MTTAGRAELMSEARKLIAHSLQLPKPHTETEKLLLQTIAVLAVILEGVSA